MKIFVFSLNLLQIIRNVVKSFSRHWKGRLSFHPHCNMWIKKQQAIWSLKGFGVAPCFTSTPTQLNLYQMSYSYFAVVRHKYTQTQLHWQRSHPSKYIPTQSKQCTAYIGNCLAGFAMFIPFGCSQFHSVVVFYSIHESVWTRTLSYAQAWSPAFNKRKNRF